jgi:predicted PurR-regulated permease PerM
MIVGFYWMTEKAIIKRVVLGLFPLRHRDRAHGLWDQIEQRLGGWTRGQLVLMGTIGILSTIGYYLIGIPFWLPLGIFAGLTEVIPFIGPFIGGGAAVTVALTVSLEKALIVLGFVILLQQLEGAVLVPRVMKNAVGMSPLTVVIAVLVGGTILGPIGAILSIPVGAAAQALLQDLLRQRQDGLEQVDVSAPVAAAGATAPAATVANAQPSSPPIEIDGHGVPGGTVAGPVERRPPLPTG